jgi:hypothetical protein
MEEKRLSEIAQEFKKAYFGKTPEQHCLNSCRVYHPESGELSVNVCLETDPPDGLALPEKFQGLPVLVTVQATVFPY